MPVLDTPEVGKLFLPELSRMTFLPGKSTAVRARHLSVVRVSVRDGSTGRKLHAGYGLGTVQVEGLRERWQEDEALQRLYPTPEIMLQRLYLRGVAASNPLKYAWVFHNERVDNGGKMVSKGFFSTSSSPDHTVLIPARLAVNKTAAFTASRHDDKSLGDGSGTGVAVDITTNEFTSLGLTRTAALTPGAVTDPSTLNGQLSFTLSNVFTATGAASAYGAGIFDAASGTSNMFAEAPFSLASLQNLDTLTVTFTVSN